MIKKPLRLMICALFAGTLCGPAADVSQAESKLSKQPFETSKIALAKGSLTLEAVGSKGGKLPDNLVFQWKKDGLPIPGATMKTYTISDASKSSVGIYGVTATREGTQKEFETANYIVSLMLTNPGSGTLTVPVGDFTSGSMSCCGVTGFDRYKVYVPFDGPGVVTPSPSFPNPLNKPKLTVDTLTGNSTTLNTCIFIRQTTAPLAIVGCNDDYPTPPGNKLSAATATLSSGRQYRATICYKHSTLGGAATITWNYLYHD